MWTKILKCEIDEFIIDGDTYAVLNGIEPWFAMGRFEAVSISQFDKTVFFTLEEAEKAWKELYGKEEE